MIARLAGTFVLISQLLVLWVVFAPSAKSATAFAFGGHAALAIGILRALLARALARARRRALLEHEDRAERDDVGPLVGHLVAQEDVARPPTPRARYGPTWPGDSRDR
jgi:hypothetical protein